MVGSQFCSWLKITNEFIRKCFLESGQGVYEHVHASDELRHKICFLALKVVPEWLYVHGHTSSQSLDVEGKINIFLVYFSV